MHLGIRFCSVRSGVTAASVAQRQKAVGNRELEVEESSAVYGSSAYGAQFALGLGAAAQELGELFARARLHRVLRRHER